jgi:hypothetical protein
VTIALLVLEAVQTVLLAGLLLQALGLLNVVDVPDDRVIGFRLPEFDETFKEDE